MKHLFVVLSLILGAHAASARPGEVTSPQQDQAVDNNPIEFVNGVQEDDVILDAPELKDVAEGYCADPSMTFEERSEIISRSVEDAIACMGEKWVFDDVKPTNISLGGMAIDVNVAASHMVVTAPDGRRVDMAISPGGIFQGKRHDTQTGRYTKFLRMENANYVVQSKDVAYTGAPMPWANFYDGGYAIHGTYATGRLGSPASHGCIRTTIANAHQIQLWAKSVSNSFDLNVHGRIADAAPVRRQPKPKVNPYEVQPQVDPSYQTPGSPYYREQSPYPGYAPQGGGYYREQNPGYYRGQPQVAPAPVPRRAPLRVGPPMQTVPRAYAPSQGSFDDED